ncbi:MAG: hypothetical protein DMF65_10335 [Acidobacteria bacterium]|nr:MAG: hypothetical protein DMF65_10335 [Acidobacteriota bacterium]
MRAVRSMRAMFKREQRHPSALVLARLRVVRQKDALAGDIGDAVEKFVDRMEAEVRHPDAVHVRVAQRHAQTRAALPYPALFGRESAPVTFYNSLRHTSAKNEAASREFDDSDLPPVYRSFSGLSY